MAMTQEGARFQFQNRAARASHGGVDPAHAGNDSRYDARLMRLAFMTSRFSAALVFVVMLGLTGVVAASEKVLYDKASAYNNIIVTEDDDGLRVLRFERAGARQSIAKPGDPTYLGFAYTRTAFVALGLVAEPRRIMIVGLGGGTMPMFLHHYYPAATIDVVDIDPEVVNVSKEYFGFREDETLHAHIGDGRKFVESVRQ